MFLYRNYLLNLIWEINKFLTLIILVNLLYKRLIGLLLKKIDKTLPDEVINCAF